MTRSPMRVLVVGDHAPDRFADNIATSLRDGGHEVKAVPTFRWPLSGAGRLRLRVHAGLQLVPAAARRVQRHVVDAAEEFAPDLVINIDSRLSYTLVAEIRSASGAPAVFWFPDSPGNLGRETHLLADYDALFLKDSSIVERYRRVLGKNAFYLPEACNPRWHRPTGDLAGPTDRPWVLVAGNMYVTRFDLLRELVSRGIGVEIYGPQWAPWLPHDPVLQGCYKGRSIYREEKARVFRSAPVVLNSMASHEADGLNVRLFEAAGCGAVVLTEWRSRLPELFEEGNEVNSYRDVDELVAKIRKLAALPSSEREELAIAAAVRAHGEHTYMHRYDTMLTALGGG
jgi:spore maturation protein CgeB